VNKGYGERWFAVLAKKRRQEAINLQLIALLPFERGEGEGGEEEEEEEKGQRQRFETIRSES
jgi:hypothetical protein